MSAIMNFFQSLHNPYFYGALLFIALFAWGMFGKYFRKLSIRKGHIMLVGIIGLALVFGGLSMLGIGSTGITTGSAVVSQLQTTTSYVLYNATDSGTDDTRMSVFYIDEGTIVGNRNIEAGTFQVWRSGNLNPTSCNVRVIKPPRYDIADTTYHLIDEDVSTGKMYAYIYTGAGTDTADGDEPREVNSLAFAEGVNTGFVAFNITIDETGIDPLTQWNSKDIQTDICGYPYVFRIVKQDA